MSDVGKCLEATKIKSYFAALMTQRCKCSIINLTLFLVVVNRVGRVVYLGVLNLI